MSPEYKVRCYLNRKQLEKDLKHIEALLNSAPVFFVSAGETKDQALLKARSHFTNYRDIPDRYIQRLSGRRLSA